MVCEQSCGCRHWAYHEAQNLMAKASEKSNTESPVRVVLVDDDKGTREVVQDAVTSTGEFVVEAQFADAESAIAGLTAEWKLAIVLMDINMPGLDGPEAVAVLKRRHPSAQFVMLTVYEDSDNIFRALASGASGYLLKRSTPADLVAALREVRAGGSPMSSQIARKVVQSFRAGKQDADPTSELSDREAEVLDFLAQGYLYKEIAAALDLSVSTVNTYVRRIYEKLHVHSRSQAVAVYSGRPIRRDGA